MKISLVGKKALVGGSTKGIGKAIAYALASAGAEVCLMARNEEKLQEIVADLPSEQGQKHDYFLVNFSDFNAFKESINAFFSTNSIDILINNTQGPSAGTALEKTSDDYQNAFDLLFKAAVFTTEKALEGMRKKKWGRVINVASITVREPLSHLVLSNSIRAALTTWGKSLSAEVAAENITVNSILTGYFDTERLSELIAFKAEQAKTTSAHIQENMENEVPMKRLGKPEEYGYLVCFLASDKASYITGTLIPIDGGLLRSM